MHEISYANIVGSIKYVMVCKLLDIVYIVRIISRFMSNLGRAHWHALRWIHCYLKGSLGRVLVYGGAK